MKMLNRHRTPRFIRLLQRFAYPLEYLEMSAKKYGDTFKVGGENSPGAVYLSHPQAIQQVFNAPPETFDSGRGNQLLNFLLGDNSLILLDGDRHQRQRKLLTPPFYADRMRAYSQLICDLTQQATTEWQIGKSFNVRTYMQEITLRVILQAVFGLHQGERYDQLQQLLTALLETIGSPLGSTVLFFPVLQKDWGAWSPWGRFLRLRQQVDELIYTEIRERRKIDNSNNDILTLLMSAQDQDGQPMTDEELHDELMTLLVAGHETTASALTWALYWSHYHPEVLEKLRYELQSIGDNLDPNLIAKLPYLTAVCQETLRIYPITATTFIRILKSPLEIMGDQLEAGTMLIPCVYLAHHREDLYPESKHFRPERFLERQFSPYEYFPFGGGNRRCIGMGLAQLEMKLALATILSRFELALTSNHPVKPVRRGLTMAPPGNLRMVVKNKRENVDKNISDGRKD